jgi:hypothetical protein
LLSVLTLLAARDGIENVLLLSPLPLAGLALGVISLRRIRAYPDQVSGRGAAVAGVGLSTAFLAGSLAYAAYVRATEVPPGYTPTSFADFKPDEVELRGNHVVPPDVAALNGEKVFIQGYFRPDSAPYTENVKEFLLVRDNNQCCFGDLSSVQFFDQIAIGLVGGKTVDFTQRLLRLGGKLHIKPENVGSKLPVYILEADYVQ